MIVLFYASELLITEKRGGWSGLTIGAMVAGLIMGARGLLLGAGPWSMSSSDEV
jgi:hypothetical protein